MATALPPTTRSLPQTQRTNLIRTTRKLGAILGETPILLEPPRGHHAHSSSVSSVSSIESKRSGRIFTSRPSLTVAEPAPPSPTGASPVSDRPMLLLRLPPAARPRPLSLSLASPLSPAFSRSPPMSPLTPTIVVDRRKKMAKLVRTLGAHVPPELVFAGPASPLRTVIPTILQSLEPQQLQRQRLSSLRRRMSDASLASPTREAFASSYAAQFTGADGDNDDWIDLGGTSSAPASPSPDTSGLRFFVQPSSPAWNASASVDDLHMAYASTPSSPPAHESTTTRSTADTRFLSRHFEFRRAGSPFAPADGYREDWAQKSSTHRREQGWSGEWTGAGGMEDVVANLRGLRLK